MSAGKVGFMTLTVQDYDGTVHDTSGLGVANQQEANVVSLRISTDEYEVFLVVQRDDLSQLLALPGQTMVECLTHVEATS